jgi:hypothetical protein
VTDLLPSELALLLAPARAALERVAPEVRRAVEAELQAARPILELTAAQAAAWEARADAARDAAEHAVERSQRVGLGIEEAVRREQRRWHAVVATVGAAEGGTSGTDAIVRALQLEGPVASAEDFDEFMLDDTLSLRLGPASTATPAGSSAERLALIAKPRPTPARDTGATQSIFERCSSATALTNVAHCGACVDTDAGQAVLLGDGTAVVPEDGTAARKPAPEGPWRRYDAQRWAAGGPPVFLPSARAGLAAILAGRSAGIPNARTWAASALFGAAFEPQPDGAVSAGRLAKAIWQVVSSSGGGPLAAACYELSYLTMRVTVALADDLVRDGTQELIDVGRVRWCDLTGQAITWLPLEVPEPDAVGGGDRPWTADPPAAGATWLAEPPSLRLSPDWFAAVLIDPATGELMVLAPDATWWTFDADFEAIALSRRDHVDPWLRALEVFEEEMPKHMKRVRELPSSSAAHPPQHRIDPATEPERFSKAWILERAGRYAYADDSAAQEAGARAAAAGAYSREDFLTVVRWKSARAVPRAERNSASSVDAATRAAFGAPDERLRMAALLTLGGVGVPVASALLHFAFPNNYPILTTGRWRLWVSGQP